MFFLQRNYATSSFLGKLENAMMKGLLETDKLTLYARLRNLEDEDEGRESSKKCLENLRDLCISSYEKNR